jgi:hypothetical protein
MVEYTHIHIYIYTTHTRTHARTHTRAHTHAHTHTHTHTHTHLIEQPGPLCGGLARLRTCRLCRGIAACGLVAGAPRLGPHHGELSLRFLKLLLQQQVLGGQLLSG